MFDEKEEKIVDHSLNEVIDFSMLALYLPSFQNKLCPTRKKEALIVKKEPSSVMVLCQDKDSSILIDFSDSMFGLQKSYRMLCQLTARIPSGKKAVGSGFKIHDNKGYILTCAHNIVSWSTIHEKFVRHKSVLCYEMRQGDNSWMRCQYLDESIARIHPKWNDDPESGFDIAVCSPGGIVSEGMNKDAFVKYHGKADVLICSCEVQDLEVGMSVEVAGYPVHPREKLGQPWAYKGEIVGWERKKDGGYILLYDVDCPLGTAGSPIMITDRWYLTKQKVPPGVRIVIGIHIGNREDGDKFGTLITKSLKKWFDGQDCAQRRPSGSISFPNDKNKGRGGRKCSLQ